MAINLPSERAIELLKKCLSSMRLLTAEDYTYGNWSGAYQKWQRDTRTIIEKIFGNETAHGVEFGNATYTEDYRSEVASVSALLKSMMEEILQFGEDLPQPMVDQDRGTGDNKRQTIFIVHGHDEAARDAVSLFLRDLDLVPVVLATKAGRGRTIIEKFEDHSDVAFAVVLLTPDDVGASVHDDTVQARARQNVIFEFGFFLGKLGREGVAVLVKEGVEMLSDYSGVQYVPYDPNGGWRLELANEMKAAGLDFDMNRLLPK